MKLQINTDRAGSTVLLFARPANGVYLPPTLMHLDGKSTVREIEVVKRDMPNFSSRRSPWPTAASTRRPARSSSRRRTAC